MALYLQILGTILRIHFKSGLTRSNPRKTGESHLLFPTVTLTLSSDRFCKSPRRSANAVDMNAPNIVRIF